MHVDANQRAGHIDHTLGNVAEFAQTLCHFQVV
jgi:hypothetical protein